MSAPPGPIPVEERGDVVRHVIEIALSQPTPTVADAALEVTSHEGTLEDLIAFAKKLESQAIRLRVVGVAGLATMLDMGETTIYRWCSTTIFPPGFPAPLIGLNKKWVWSIAAIERWLESASAGKVKAEVRRISLKRGA